MALAVFGIRSDHLVMKLYLDYYHFLLLIILYTLISGELLMLGLKCFDGSARGSSDSTSPYIPSVCCVIRRKTLGLGKLVWHG